LDALNFTVGRVSSNKLTFNSEWPKYLIGPFDVSKFGKEIVNLLEKGSNSIITDGVLEGIGGASAMEEDKI
jgi:hypothetical protein